MASSELDKHPARTVDPHDEPSAEWGWHGRLPVGTQLAGWFVVVACFGMLIGNQIGHVEDIYLVATGTIVAFLLLRSLVRRRDAWRR